jgi:carnosine N-methyltransferase
MKKLETNLDASILGQDKDELKRLIITLYAMENYKYHNRYQIEKFNYDVSNIDQKYIGRLNYDIKQRIQLLDQAMTLNQNMLLEIVKNYWPDDSYLKNYNNKELLDQSYNEYSILNYAVFMHILRDWTAERQKEREAHYVPIVQSIQKCLSTKARILIPGAGMFRLGYELACLGHDIEGNDYSFFNVVICDYIFNQAKKNQFTFQPLIRSFSNFFTEDSAYRKYSFPDCDILTEGRGKMSMYCGDFVKLYENQANAFDCVITCFFLDTAKNIIEYIDIIHKILKQGGFWINLGPLCYHYAGYQSTPILELPYDKLKDVIINTGFEYIEESKKDLPYCEIDDYMKNDFYSCVYFNVRKK